jgi:hypothetical protein
MNLFNFQFVNNIINNDFFTALASVSNACVTYDFAHGGHDILVGGHYNIKASWEECQTSCQAVTECLFW